MLSPGTRPPEALVEKNSVYVAAVDGVSGLTATVTAPIVVPVIVTWFDEAGTVSDDVETRTE